MYWSVRACIHNEGAREGNTEERKFQAGPTLSEIFKCGFLTSANYAPILVSEFSSGWMCRPFKSHETECMIPNSWMGLEETRLQIIPPTTIADEKSSACA